MPQMILNPSSGTSITVTSSAFTTDETTPSHRRSPFRFQMLVLLRSAPLFTSMPLSLLLLLLLLSLFSLFSPFSVFAIALFATLSTCRVHASHATRTHTHTHTHSHTHSLTHSLQYTHTHTHTHTHSKYGCVLPSTDARRITVREITVNICSMNMMRLAERRRGEEDNLLCHLSLYGCLSYITPSLSLYLPAHLSLTHFHHLSFSVLPSFPPTFCLFIFSHSHAQLTPPPHSLLLSHSSHLSLVSPFPATSLRMPSLICLI